MVYKPENDCKCGYQFTEQDFEDSEINGIVCPECGEEDEVCQYCKSNLPFIDDEGLCICRDCHTRGEHKSEEEA